MFGSIYRRTQSNDRDGDHDDNNNNLIQNHPMINQNKKICDDEFRRNGTRERGRGKWREPHPSPITTSKRLSRGHKTKSKKIGLIMGLSHIQYSSPEKGR